MNEDRFRFVADQQMEKAWKKLKKKNRCVALLASTYTHKKSTSQSVKNLIVPLHCPERAVVRGDVRSIWNWFWDLQVDRTTAKKRTVSDVTAVNRGQSDTVTAWNWKAVSVRRDRCLCYNTEEGVALKVVAPPRDRYRVCYVFAYFLYLFPPEGAPSINLIGMMVGMIHPIGIFFFEKWQTSAIINELVLCYSLHVVIHGWNFHCS